jgi:hypothetical protein
MGAENMNEELNRDFSVLTEENKKKVVEMVRFLVLIQNAIIPEMLTLNSSGSLDDSHQLGILIGEKL